MEFVKLREEMIAAMKKGEKQRKNVISGLIAAVKKTAIDGGCREDISEDIVDATILKEMKAAKEQLDTCPKERAELIEEYSFNLSVIQEFAPKQMSEEEIKSTILNDYAEVIASKNKGMIMKTIMPVFKGKADGKLVQQVVNALLAD